MQNHNPTIARLLAKENITVQHGNYKTAWFDIKDRILGLPLWKDMGKDVYDLLCGHEVGHALYTPYEGWHDSPEKIKGVPRSYINVIEDARIERFIQRDYPGLVGPFKRGYFKLVEQGFFGDNISDMDFEEVKLIDKINIKAKVGNLVDVPFNDEEIVFYKRAMTTVKFSEVIELCKDILEYTQENTPELLSQPPQPMEDGDIEIPEGDEEMDGPPQGHDDGPVLEEEEEKVKTEQDSADGDESDDCKEDNNDSSESNDDDTPSADDLKKKEKGKQENKPLPIEQSERSLTDDIQRSKEEDLLDTDEHGTQPLYMREPSKEAIDQIIISYEELDKQRKYAQSLMTKYDKERLPNAQKGFDTYIKEVKKAANYAVKEFEMRKAAFQWQRAQTAKSGSLDVNKVHSYKYNEDIFARVTNLANAKNHGMIMMIDYSGSMSSTLASVIDQLIHLVTFCKLVNIPFDVYAFTTGNDYETQAKLARDGDIDFSNVSMPLLISSKLKKAQFKEALMALYMRRQCLSSDRWETNEYGDYFTEMPYDSSICAKAEEWGSTPLNHCLVLAHGLVRKFKARHNVDKMNLIVLSDGDSNGMHAFRDRERTDRTDVKRYGTSTVYVDGKNLKMENLGRYATAELLNNIRKRYGCNTLGFFISTDAYEFRNKLRMMDEYDTAPANKEYRKNKCVRRVNSLGYDEFYLVKGGKQLKTNIEDFDVKEEASTAQVRNAFKKFSKSKKKNKVLLTNFGKAVA